MNGKLRLISKITALTFIMLSLSGCFDDRETSITTQVRGDGSIGRTILRDSAPDEMITFYPYRLRAQDRYIVYSTKNEGEKHPVSYTRYFAEYKNVRELKKSVEQESLPGTLRVDPDLKKSYRFLYTYYTYTERMEKYNPYRTRKLEDYIGDKKLTDLSDDTVSNGIARWINDSCFDELYSSVTEAYPDNQALISFFETKKKDAVRDYGEVLSELRKRADFIEMTGGDPDNFEEIEVIDRKSQTVFKALLSRLEGFDVVMPGTIISTNALQVNGGTAHFGPIDCVSLLVKGQEIRVVSRKFNIISAAVASSLLLILIGVSAGCVPKFRKMLRGDRDVK